MREQLGNTKSADYHRDPLYYRRTTAVTAESIIHAIRARGLKIQ
jgi:hypothetical protein